MYIENNSLENIRGRKCIFKVLRVYYQGINGTLKLYMTRTRGYFICRTDLNKNFFVIKRLIISKFQI